MARVKIKSNKLNKVFYKQLKNICSSFKNGIKDANFDIAKDLKATVYKDLDDKKSGRIYVKRLKGRLVRHQASAPYEPPANFTGNLKNSIETKESGASQLTFSAGDAKVNYAGFLERGTSKMIKRPYLIKSIEDNQKNTVQAYYKSISTKLNKR